MYVYVLSYKYILVHYELNKPKDYCRITSLEELDLRLVVDPLPPHFSHFLVDFAFRVISLVGGVEIMVA